MKMVSCEEKVIQLYAEHGFQLGYQVKQYLAKRNFRRILQVIEAEAPDTLVISMTVAGTALPLAEQ
jgi:hypothetical protein